MNFAQFLTQEAALPAGSSKIPVAPGPLPAAAGRGKEGKPIPSHALSTLASKAAQAGVASDSAPGTPPLSMAWQPPAPLAALPMAAATGGAPGKNLIAGAAGRTSKDPAGTDIRSPGPEIQNPGEKASGIAVSAALSPVPPKIPSAPLAPLPNGLPERGAKIAASVSQISAPAGSGENTPEKKSLDSDSQKDSFYDADVGIASAQGMPAMATATANHPPPTAGVDLPGAVSTQAVQASPVQTLQSVSTVSPAEASANVRATHAVETVVALVDAQASRTQGAASAVKLNFNFNGDDLAVRIQVSNGSVHTQFRTDSPELRAAISSQWQSVSSTSAGREMNFLQPSFSSANGSPDAALTSDGGASRGRDSSESEGQTPSWASANFESEVASEPASEPTPASLSTARHLHTFA
jgi:hypothetical protein